MLDNPGSQSDVLLTGKQELSQDWTPLNQLAQAVIRDGSIRLPIGREVEKTTHLPQSRATESIFRHAAQQAQEKQPVMATWAGRYKTPRQGKQLMINLIKAKELNPQALKLGTEYATSPPTIGDECRDQWFANGSQQDVSGGSPTDSLGGCQTYWGHGAPLFLPSSARNHHLGLHKMPLDPSWRHPNLTRTRAIQDGATQFSRDLSATILVLMRVGCRRRGPSGILCNPRWRFQA